MTFKRMLAVLLASAQVAGLGLAAAAEGVGEERILAEADFAEEEIYTPEEEFLIPEEEAPAEFDGYLPAEPDAEAFPDVVREDAAEPLSGDPDEVVDSGQCGDNLTWTVYGDGLLEISGEGEMWDYSYINGGNYSTAPWEQYRSSLKSLKLNEGITSIGDFAFYCCRSFTGSLTIPDSVTSIGNDAFFSCNGFTGDLIIPDSVNNIGDYAFYDCFGFEGNLTISARLTTLQRGVFYGCSGFTGSLIIPTDTIAIEESAFGDCIGFTGSLLLGINVNMISNTAFLGCKGITEFIVNSSNKYYTSINGILYTTDHQTILRCPEGKSGSLTIPDNVTTIEDYAFYGCDRLTNKLIIPASVTKIGEFAFCACSGFSGNLTIPDSVKAIGYCAFYKCSGFTGVLSLSYGITTIENNSFSCCSGFTGTLVIPDSVTVIGAEAFERCSGFNGGMIIPDSVNTIGAGAFMNCSGLTGDLIIPDGVTMISNNAFYGCTGLTGSLEIPDSVTIIGVGAFQFCRFSGNLILPKNVTTIRSKAFYGCEFTGRLTIPESVTFIGDEAFACIPGIPHVVFLGDAPEATDYIFCNSDNSFTVFFKADAHGWTTPKWHGYYTGIIPDGLEDNDLVNAGVCGDSLYWYFYCDGRLEIHGNGDMWDYSASIVTDSNGIITSAPWNRYEALLTDLNVADGVTKIGKHAFYACRFAGNLSIGKSVRTIGESAFEKCGEFAGDLLIPDSVTTIENSAFKKCTSFAGCLSIGNSVTVIGESAFEGCNGFADNLIIPDSVSLIGNSAFRGCSGFTGSLTIPDSVSSIGTHAFAACSGLTNLTIPDNVTSIGTSAFTNCTGLTEVLFLGNAPQSVGSSIFGDRQNTDFVIRCENEFADSITSDANYDATAGTWYGYPLQIIGMVLPLTVISQPASQEVEPGTPVSFTVTAARGTAPYTYQWQYLKPGAAAWVNVYAASGKTDSYSLTALLRHNGYKYRCRITDADGTSVLSDEALLTVRAPAVPLTISAQPADQTVAPGTPVSFSVTAEGGKAPYAYQWQYMTPGAASWGNVYAASGKTETYSLTAQLRHNGYQYRCRVTDADGNAVFSEAALLTVTGPLAVTYQPEDRTVLSGQSAPFVVVVTGGVQPYAYQWQYQKPGTGTWTNVTPASGGDTSCFTVPKAAARHNGWVIRCRIRDAAGSEIYTNLVTLTVESGTAPVLTQAPVGVSATPGETVTFSVRAEGPGKLSYQWQYLKPGASAWVNVYAASGKLPDYSLKVEMRHNGYRYRVVVSSDNGTSTVSGAVYLDVWEEILGAGDMLNGFGSVGPMQEEDPDFGWDLPVLDLPEKEEALWDLGLITEADVLWYADEAE